MRAAGYRNLATDVQYVHRIGNDQYAAGTVPDCAALQFAPQSAFAMFILVKLASPLEQGYLFGKTSNQNGGGPCLYIDGQLKTVALGGLTGLSYLDAVAPVRGDEMTEWLALGINVNAVAAGGGQAQIFKNGRYAYDSCGCVNFSVPATVGLDYAIGNRAAMPDSATTECDMLVARHGIWNRCLSLAEWQQMAAGATVANTSLANGMLADYWFQEGTGSTQVLNRAPNAATSGVGDYVVGQQSEWWQTAPGRYPSAAPSRRRTVLVKC